MGRLIFSRILRSACMGGLLLTSACATPQASTSSISKDIYKASGGAIKKTTPTAGKGTSGPIVTPVASYDLRVDPETLFDGCVPEVFALSTNLTCDPMVITWAESRDKSPEEFLKQQREAIKEGLPNVELREDAVAVTLEAKLLTVLRVAVFQPPEKAEPSDAAPPPVMVGANLEPSAYLFAVAYRMPDGLTRGAMCSAEADQLLAQERCLKMVSYLTLNGIPPKVLEQEPPEDEVAEEHMDGPHFMGRPMEVPEDCEVGQASELGGNISCESGSLSWFVMDREEVADNVANELANRLRNAKGLRVEERVIACEVEASPAECVQLFTVEGGEPKNAVIAQAAIGESFVVTLCYSAGSTDNMAEICGKLMGKKP
ncbi:MAG: hypothetical protein ACKO6N_10075 [Myxococcota bacterium]